MRDSCQASDPGLYYLLLHPSLSMHPVGRPYQQLGSNTMLPACHSCPRMLNLFSVTDIRLQRHSTLPSIYLIAAHTPHTRSLLCNRWHSGCRRGYCSHSFSIAAKLAASSLPVLQIRYLPCLLFNRHQSGCKWVYHRDPGPVFNSELSTATPQGQYSRPGNLGYCYFNPSVWP